MKLFYTLLGAMLMFLFFIAVGATTGGRNGFLETAIPNGVGDWQVMKGEWNCRVYGTFDSASVSVETLTEGTPASPTKVTDISVAALVGVTTETAWVSILAGHGSHRANVTGGLGSELITWTCRRVSP